MIGTGTPDASDDPTGAESRLSELDLAALSRLVDGSMPVPVGDLAADLAVRGDDSVDTGRLQVRLHHVVLPKLDDAGLVTYDADEHEVSATAGDARLLG